MSPSGFDPSADLSTALEQARSNMGSVVLWGALVFGGLALLFWNAGRPARRRR